MLFTIPLPNHALKRNNILIVIVSNASVWAMALDSEAAFQSGALEVGISSADVQALKTGGINSYSRYAFCCAYQPGSGNEDVLFDYLESILGAKPAGADASNYRRLFFESHGASMEPSHELIDRVVHQYEENCVKLVKLSKCTSREQEIKSERSTSQLSFDAQGKIKVSKQSAVTECSINGEIKLRAAFTRRRLAYDLANIASFEVLESWSQLLFDRIFHEPPTGYRHISTDQIIHADRKMWVKVAEATRSKVTGTTAEGIKNVDAALKELAHHPDVQFHTLPLPLKDSSQVSSSNQRFQPYQQDRPQGAQQQKGKGKAGGKDQGKGRIQIPNGCAIKFGENKNKPICMKFNVGACRTNIKAGKRYMHGYHVCWKVNCNSPFPYHECSHVGSS